LAIRQHFKNIALGLVLVVASTNYLLAQQQYQGVSEDLSLRLLELNEGKELVFSTDITSSSTIGFFLAKAESFEKLSLQDSIPFSVWVDGKMVQSETKDFEAEKSRLFQDADSDTLFLVLISSSQFQNLDASLLLLKDSGIALKNLPTERHIHYFQDWMIIGLLVIGLGAILMKTFFPSLFRLLFRINLLTRRGDEESGEINIETLVAALIMSMMVAYVYLLSELMSDDSEILSNWLLIVQWIEATLVILLTLMIKYVLLRVVAWLNGVRKIVNIQFNDFIKFFTIAALLLLVIECLQYWIGYYGAFNIKSLVTNTWMIIYLVFGIYFFQKLSMLTSFKKLHIISYLCTTEFIGAFLIALIIYK
jgi:hypothetical protein